MGMDSIESHDCPLCGSVMGAEAQPGAMRKHAEALDRLDRLERSLHDAEAGTWRVAVQELVCEPCHGRYVGVTVEQGDPGVAALRARIAEVRKERAAALRRTA
jgi:hypothetical protein